MDLHDFKGQEMYFDEPLPQRVTDLLHKASEAYSSGQAELPLLKAYYLAPESLTVLVGLYRFYYYQHRFADALLTAEKAMETAANKIGLAEGWQDLTIAKLGPALLKSMGLVRFYLLTLKGAAYMNLRSGVLEQGIAMLRKVIELDNMDRLGARALLTTAMRNQIGLVTEFEGHKVSASA